MLIRRHIKIRLTELLNDFRIVYLTGPRQAGKSTLAREVAKELGMGYYTLDDAALAASAESDPQGLLAALSKPLVLDEFQIMPMAKKGSSCSPALQTFSGLQRCRNLSRGIWQG